jgi:MarR family transcriptional regulator, temperature-dependent positive regulator of motility
MKYSPSTSILHRMHRVTQIGAERLSAELGDTELTERQIVVLAAIGADEGTNQTGIVNAIGVDRSTLADIVRRLVKRGLVNRKRMAEDARAYAVTLTKEGRRMLAVAGPILAKVEAGMLAGMTASQRDALAKALDSMTMKNEIA